MFNHCAKTLIKCRWPLSQTYKIFGLQNYATFAVKDILYETPEEAGTLLTRFSKHIAMERSKICKLVPTEVRYPDYFPISDIKYFQKELRKTPKEQIAAVIIYASTYRSNAEPPKFAQILNDLDRYAVENVDDMDVDTLLRTLYSFLFLIPIWMTRLDFYGRAMTRLVEECLEGGCKSKEQFVQLCFYLGLSKKQSKLNINKLFKPLLDANLNQYLPEMATLDMALVSNAAYKTSIPIDSDDFNQRLLKEVLDISTTAEGNDALLITFIKSMRFQGVRSPAVCEYIANIGKDLVKLQPRAQVHLFAYLADSLWDNMECTQPFIDTFVKEIKSGQRNSYAQSVRGKDIATFLWSCAQLNCNLTSLQLQTLENSLLDKVKAREFNYFSDQLVDSCLSLWILGYHSKELLQAAVQLKSESTSKRQQPKVDSRLTVLLSAAQIEEPKWCSNLAKNITSFSLKAKVPAYLLNSNDIPYQELVDNLSKEEEISSATITCPINGINIPGIYVKLASQPEAAVFLEFMLPSQSLHFSQEPVAILRLKLRLLHSLGHQVKVLKTSDLTGVESFKDLLHDFLHEDNSVDEPSKNSIKA